jgi:hypothetical protein
MDIRVARQGRARAAMPTRLIHRVLIQQFFVAGVLLVLLAGLVLAPATGTPSASAQDVPTPTTAPVPVKFYVVAASANGPREFLFQIATKTIGNGNRYMEIFALNEGRLQPDGRRVTDPAVVEPGWILQLPPDASGPEVQFGVMPEVRAPASGSATGAAQPDAGVAGGVGIEAIARFVLLIGLTGVLVLALHLLRRGTRITWPVLITKGRVVGVDVDVAGPVEKVDEIAGQGDGGPSHCPKVKAVLAVYAPFVRR